MQLPIDKTKLQLIILLIAARRYTFEVMDVISLTRYISTMEIEAMARVFQD